MQNVSQKPETKSKEIHSKILLNKTLNDLENYIMSFSLLSKTNQKVEKVQSKFSEFHKSIEKSKLINIHLIAWNIHSLNEKKINYLKLLLSGRAHNNTQNNIKCVPHAPDIVLLTETWLRDVGKFSIFNLKAYNRFSISRNESRGGGVLIYVKKELTAFHVNSFISSFAEILHLQVFLSKTFSVHVVGIYRPPNGQINDALVLIEHLLTEYKDNIIIMGDFNLPFDKDKGDTHFKNQAYINFIDTIETFNHKQINEAITYNYDKANSIDTSRGSILDLIICPQNNINVSLTALKNVYSDHNIIFASTIFNECKSTSNQIKKHTIKRVNFTKLKDQIAQLDFDHKLSDGDVNIKYEKLVELILNAVNSSTYTRTLKTRDETFKVPSWVNNEYINICNSVHNLKEKISKLLKFNKKCDQLQLKLTTLLIIKDNIEINRTREYYRKLLSNNCRLSWNIINSICGRSKLSNDIILKINGHFVFDNKIIADALQEEFISHVGIKEECININYRGPQVIDTFNFETVTDNYVLQLINDLEIGKSSGLDGLSPRIWKEIANNVHKTITNLINCMILENKFPNALKLAVIVPIHKKGDKVTTANYRPISLLNTVSKLFEKVIYAQIENFSISQKIGDPLQFGFSKGLGCADAIASCCHTISKEIDKGNSVILIALDFTRAFDSLNHHVLCKKLEHMGFRGNSNDLIKDFLTNRSQVVRHQDAFSFSGDIKQGVPQGSLLGPLLFNLLLSDLQYIETDYKIFKYADDALICVVIDDASNSTNETQSLLKEISSYFKENLLKINYDKSSFMVIGNREVDNVRKVLIDDGFHEAKSLKYLGVVLDQSLTMSDHIQVISTRCKQATGALLYMRIILPKDALLKFYFGHIHSHLMYCGFILARCKKSDIDKLFIIQKRALKTIYRLPTLYSTHDLFSIHAKDILPLKAMIQYSTLCLVHRLLHSVRSTNFNIELVPSTRHINIRTHKADKKIMNLDISHAGFKAFNALPSSLKSVNSFERFKKGLKIHLLSKKEEFY